MNLLCRKHDLIYCTNHLPKSGDICKDCLLRSVDRYLGIGCSVCNGVYKSVSSSQEGSADAGNQSTDTAEPDTTDYRESD